MITVQQLQMARAALGWSLDVLGEKSGVSSRTIRRIESEGGLEKATAANLTHKTNIGASWRRIYWQCR